MSFFDHPAFTVARGFLVLAGAIALVLQRGTLALAMVIAWISLTALSALAESIDTSTTQTSWWSMATKRSKHAHGTAPIAGRQGRPGRR